MTSTLKAVPASLVYRRPVAESAPTSTQLKSATQVITGNVHDVEPPKLQVVAPASAGVVVVLKVVVPPAGKLMGVMFTVPPPAGIVNAPKLGREAALPVKFNVPVATAAV